MGDAKTVLEAGVVEGITQRLSLLPDVHLPFSLSRQGDSLSQSDKKAHLVDLLRRDAAVFLERHGSKLSCSELQEFDILKEDYEVSWHLERLKTSMEPTAKQNRAHNALVKNRRLAYMDKLIQDGEFFSEDAMKMRAPLLYYEYLGKFQDPSEKAFARPGEKWSDMLIRQREEVEYQERLKKQREEAGMPESDEEQEEEEEEDAQVEEEDGQGQQVTQGKEVEYQECLKKQREDNGVLKSDEEQEEEEEEEEEDEEEEDEEEEEEDSQGREGTQVIQDTQMRLAQGVTASHDEKRITMLMPGQQPCSKLEEFSCYMFDKFIADESSKRPTISDVELQCKKEDFVRLMQEKFLSGEDAEHFDYGIIDSNASLDDYWLDEVTQDAQDRYFNED